MDDADLYRLYSGIYEVDDDDDDNIKKIKNNNISEENKIQICRLALLTKHQQKDWVNLKYNKLFPKNKYNIDKMYNLHKKSDKQSKILELLRIPILLQLIVSENFYGNAKNNAELYDTLFKKILDTRKEETRNKKQYFKRIFQFFAYSIYKNNNQYTFIESKELDENRNEKWKAVLLFYMKNIKSNQQNKYYIEFVHRTFYQYFQAWYFFNLVLEIVKENDENIKKEKTAKLFEAICWRKIERDVIDLIKQINQNQEQIQSQEQIQYILDSFEETDGFIRGKNGEWYLPIGEVNILDRVEDMIYNLLMILNIVLPNRLILSNYKRIEQLIKRVDITNIYLPNIILSNLNLQGINLQGAYLEGAYLEQTNLQFAHLLSVNLIKAHLEEANLNFTNLKFANLKEARLKEAYLNGAYLSYTHLEGAHLEGAYLEGAHLEGAHLEEAHLNGAYLGMADLIWARLEDADLTGAYLGMANLTEARFKRAHLIGADLTESILVGADLTEANLKWADLAGIFLTGTYFIGSYLKRINLTKTNLMEACFDPSILKNAILKDTKISKNRCNEIAALVKDISKIIWCD